MSAKPRIVYFSSVTENTKHLVDKTPYEAQRIPLRRTDEELFVDYPYVLIAPSYGGGSEDSAVPKQIINFLNNKKNRSFCLGVISAGNTNFGKDYCIAGRILQRKLQVPNYYNFELRGTTVDLERITEGIQEVFDKFNEGEISPSLS